VLHDRVLDEYAFVGELAEFKQFTFGDSVAAPHVNQFKALLSNVVELFLGQYLFCWVVHFD
jgi:hypothetical protein